MDRHRHSIYGFVGPSGSGKSTLISKMIEIFPHLQIIKSTTTRLRRDLSDDAFYNFISDAEFEEKIKNNEFINFHKYTAYWYGTNLVSTQEVLEHHCGTFALVENSVEAVRSSGIDLKLIKINPDTSDLARMDERKQADMQRAAIPLNFDLVIQNSFQAGGLEKAINQLTQYFKKNLSDHDYQKA